MNITITQNQKERVQDGWSAIAGEQVTIDCTDLYAPIYAYGSELACLRLFRKFPNGRAAYSENLKTWFFYPKVQNPAD